MKENDDAEDEVRRLAIVKIERFMPAIIEMDGRGAFLKGADILRSPTKMRECSAFFGIEGVRAGAYVQ